MKRVMFACGEPSCPRKSDRTAKLSYRRVRAVAQALSDRPVCSTCESPMGVYDVVHESESDSGKEEATEFQEEEAYAQEEARIQRRISDRYRRANTA